MVTDLDTQANGSGIKAHLKGALAKAGIYQRAKASFIYDVYWTIADKRIVEDRQQEIRFYRGLLSGFRSGHTIFDIGANQGYKTGIFLSLGAEVVALEPDPASQQTLRETFLKYRLQKKPVVIVPKAVSDNNSIERLWIDAPGSAKNTLSQKWAATLRVDDKRFGEKHTFGQWRQVETVTMEKLFAEHGVPYFVKIDVEGHELSVLRGMQRPVPYLSFEVNLPEFMAEGLECVQTLRRLARDGTFNYIVDCRLGLALTQWVGAEAFLPILSACGEKSIEVFWKTVGV